MKEDVEMLVPRGRFGFGLLAMEGGGHWGGGGSERPRSWTRSGPPDGRSGGNRPPGMQNWLLALSILGTIVFVAACEVLT